MLPLNDEVGMLDDSGDRSGVSDDFVAASLGSGRAIQRAVAASQDADTCQHRVIARCPLCVGVALSNFAGFGFVHFILLVDNRTGKPEGLCAAVMQSVRQSGWPWLVPESGHEPRRQSKRR